MGLLGGEADFRFDGGKTRMERATEKKAAALAAAAQEEAVLPAELVAVEAACEPEARERDQTAGARDLDRARAGSEGRCRGRYLRTPLVLKIEQSEYP